GRRTPLRRRGRSRAGHPQGPGLLAPRRRGRFANSFGREPGTRAPEPGTRAPEPGTPAPEPGTRAVPRTAPGCPGQGGSGEAASRHLRPGAAPGQLVGLRLLTAESGRI